MIGNASKNNFQFGFTLVEIVITVGVFVLLAALVSNFQTSIFVQNDEGQRRIAAEAEARSTLKKMIAELRSAAYSNVGDYPIIMASSSAITFFSDLDNDGLRERIRYYLSGRLLRKAVLKPTGWPPQYLEAGEVISYEVSDIINSDGKVFEYYDRDYTGSSSPLTYPINIAAIRLVKVIVTIDANPSRAPEPIIFESQVMIRNLKDNL